MSADMAVVSGTGADCDVRAGRLGGKDPGRSPGRGRLPSPRDPGRDSRSASSRARSMPCKASQTPTRYQSRRRRQQVMPASPSIARGRYSRRMPALSTNRMPVRQTRSATSGRPPRERGGRAGRSGEITLQSSSKTRGATMELRLRKIRLCWRC